MKLFLTLAALAFTMANPAAALDCSAPPPVKEIRLYVGSVFDPDDQIVPGQDLPIITTCALGTVSDAAVERQWEAVESAWTPYEALMLELIEPPPLHKLAFPDLTTKAESFNIGAIAFVDLGKHFTDLSESAIIIADIITYATRRESTGGNGTVMRYDRVNIWSPNQVSERLVIVFDDGQIISAEIDHWREGCRDLTFISQQLDQGLYPDFQLLVADMGDICSVTARELAPAKPR